MFFSYNVPLNPFHILPIYTTFFTGGVHIFEIINHLKTEIRLI